MSAEHAIPQLSDLPEELFKPTAPLYILPSALPASGKTTFLRLYASYMRAEDYEVRIISHDDTMHEVMDLVNSKNKGKPGYPLSYVDLHPNNHKDAIGKITDEAKYTASCKAMRSVVEGLARKECDARMALAKGGKLIVIHDNLHLTKDGRANLLNGGLVNTIDYSLKAEDSIEIDGKQVGNSINVGIRIPVNVCTIAAPFNLSEEARAAFQEAREAGGGHKVPAHVIGFLKGIVAAPETNEGFSCVVPVLKENGMSLTDILAKELGFKDAKEAAGFITALDTKSTIAFMLNNPDGFEVSGNRTLCYQQKDAALDKVVKEKLQDRNIQYKYGIQKDNSSFTLRSPLWASVVQPSKKLGKFGVSPKNDHASAMLKSAGHGRSPLN